MGESDETAIQSSLDLAVLAFKSLTICLCIVPISGCNVIRPSNFTRNQLGTTAISPTNTGVPLNTSLVDVMSNTVNSIYSASILSVFTITTISGSNQSNSQPPSEDLGTGFLIDNNGNIATNDHVVGSASTVTVQNGGHTDNGR